MSVLGNTKHSSCNHLKKSQVPDVDVDLTEIAHG